MSEGESERVRERGSTHPLADIVGAYLDPAVSGAALAPSAAARAARLVRGQQLQPPHVHAAAAAPRRAAAQPHGGRHHVVYHDVALGCVHRELVGAAQVVSERGSGYAYSNLGCLGEKHAGSQLSTQDPFHAKDKIAGRIMPF